MVRCEELRRDEYIGAPDPLKPSELLRNLLSSTSTCHTLAVGAAVVTEEFRASMSNGSLRALRLPEPAVQDDRSYRVTNWSTQVKMGRGVDAWSVGQRWRGVIRSALVPSVFRMRSRMTWCVNAVKEEYSGLIPLPHRGTQTLVCTNQVTKVIMLHRERYFSYRE